MSEKSEVKVVDNTTSYEEVPPKSDYPEIPDYAKVTDVGNAIRVENFLRGLAFYHPALKCWFLWLGTHWAKDKRGEITRLAVRAISRIAEFEPGLMEWLVKSLANSKITAAIKLAAVLLPLTAELDGHPFKLNVKNGTVDLKTGELLPHCPDDYITKIANAEYLPHSECPKWQEFIKWVFSDFEEGIRYFQKILGYALTSDVSEKRFFIMWGPQGNNGKTLIINVLRGILGVDYCVQVDAETLTHNRIKQIRSDIMRLDDKRAAFTSETGDQYKFNEPLMKALTGGDAITARNMRENEKEFTPEIKLLIATNRKPVFNLSDPAMMSRVDIIPFLNSVKPEEINRNLTEELLAEEAAGILAWAVEGAVMWAKEGLGDNPFDQASASVVKPIATISTFVSACCNEGPGLEEKTSALHQAYEVYKDEIGDESPTPSLAEFGKQMTNAGHLSTHRRDGNSRQNLALKPEWKEKLTGTNQDGTSAAAAPLEF